MAVKDVRPEIKLDTPEQERLITRLEEMIEEAGEFRKSSEWEERHGNYWRMYRAEPKQKVRNWPWPNASNLYIPLAKVAVNATVAQEYEAMLSNEPQVIGTEGGDSELADNLTQYYFGYFYKQVMPLLVWGTDWLLDNAVDGTSAMKIRQNVDFVVRRSESMRDVPIYTQLPQINPRDPFGPPVMADILERMDYEWEEQATIERVNETTADVCDLTRIYMAPTTGAGTSAGGAFYSDSCPWYFTEAYYSWDELMGMKKSMGWDVDDALKAHLVAPDQNDKDRAVNDSGGTSENAKPPAVRVREFFLRWPLPFKYMKIDEREVEEIKQKTGAEDGFHEEIVVEYVSEAKRILGIRPLSRVAPDGKRPHVTMHYQRIPRYPYGAGQCEELRDLQAGINKSWNQRADYGDLSNMPWGFYSPGATGLLPEIGGLEPGRMYEVMDPKGIYFHKFSMDPMFYMSQDQAIQNWAEKVSRVTEALMGKSPSTPNAPRTARGQLAMIQQNNMQFAVLTGIHAESFKEVFRRVHAFKRRWAPKTEEFRVLNRQNGMFKRATITDRAFQYDADFDFKMNANRNQEQQISQALFGITMSAVQQALKAPMLAPMIRKLTKDVYRDLGRNNFDQIWPDDTMSAIAGQAAINLQTGQQPDEPNAKPPATPEGAPPPEAGPEQPELNMQMGGMQ